jgi:hypothetical protein
MKRLNGRSSRVSLALGVILLTSLPASAQPEAKLTALSHLEPGLWEIRELGNPDAVPQSICVADPGLLMQVKHGTSACSRVIIANAQDSATVHYTCPSNGFGDTSIRVETPRLAKIDTQGLVGNVPFAYRAEARRLGACEQKKSVPR